ncbi:MAG: R-phenyllactate dehydratase beta subunit [Syntrophorhabdaceae bacterium PtaU1.Bin034]|nr:MAG: R-phenyllactate dehydratase beta subunit [Syntrophorhabdaceae bacterium PtaU1.Bin034]
MWENLGFDKIVEYAGDPYASIRQWKRETGKKLVGSTLADVPEEVVYAFGFLPVTLLGTHKPLKKAPSLLPDNACSLARSNLELALTYENDLFDGFVLPQVCDTTQHMCDIWRINFPGTYVESILLPRQIDRESARYWVRKETERLISSLENWSKTAVTDDALRESIRIHNENKRLLKELYDIKRENPATLTNKQMFSLIKLSMQVDKKEMNETLRAVRANLKITKGEGYTPVVLTGIACDPLDLFDLFDELKLNVVADTLVTGSRYLQGVIDENKEPLDAMTERHFKRGFYSPIHDDVFKNVQGLKALYREYNAKAVIYVHIEFCESEEYDLPDLKSMVKKEGVPFHTLVTEYQTLSLSHVRTRLQAFFESLKGGTL